ncbi:MAG: sortase A [Candidatus Berkelbacteria bacterium Gr01-1014_85]|uniref:Sortase A n=1 Tax=Candidatus Berkelbacteria bacterium Gr01-1014_85 TaxID=2017150 RepID=A0A554JC37_9BACT|nr:MAG: sortase A [Candidatus Berkelbacteria bacterium Gr01-1014_85]
MCEFDSLLRHQIMFTPPFSFLSRLTQALYVVIFIFVVINFPALSVWLSYQVKQWRAPIARTKLPTVQPIKSATNQNPVSPNPFSSPFSSPQTSPQTTPEATLNSTGSTSLVGYDDRLSLALSRYQLKLDSLADNQLMLPTLGQTWPIQINVEPGADLETALMQALESGVARYPGSGLPNQIGNTFILGHSSNYWWSAGRYRTTFTLLPQLIVGDPIIIKYEQQLYYYRVKHKQVIAPDKLEVLAPTKTPTLTLMTCYPIGSTKSRLIIVADLVRPINLSQTQPSSPLTALTKDRLLAPR